MRRPGVDRATVKNWQIIDLVRTFSLVAVMADHAFTNPVFHHAWAAWLWGRFCVNGSNGVLIFFLVSGFLITSVLARGAKGLLAPDVPRFYVQRAGRIWPLYFLLVFLGFLVFEFFPRDTAFYANHFPGGAADPWFWASILTFTFNWYFAVLPGAVLGTQWQILWSLAIEEQFYLLYPWFLKAAKRTDRLAWMLALLGSAGVGYRWVAAFYGPVNDLILSYPTPAEFDLFALGIALYLAREKWGRFLSDRRAWSLGLCLFGLALAAVSYMGVYPKRTLGIVLFPDLLGLGVFCALMGGMSLPFFEWKIWRPFSWTGKYCYGGYLFHPLVLFGLRHALPGLSPVLDLAVLVVVTTMFAALSYHFFEFPVNQAIRSHFGRWRSGGGNFAE